MVLFPLIATLVFVLYLRRSFRSTKGFCLFNEVYGGRLVFFQKESFCASHAPHSHRSLDNYSVTRLHRCLILGKAGKYNYVIRILQFMMRTITSENTIVALSQLHPLPSYHVPPLIFDY
jgi:hypothetical protein